MAEKPFVLRDDLEPDFKKIINRVRDNFMICMVKRNGGRMEFPVAEVDAANDLLTMTIEGDVFVLTTEARN